MSWWWLSSNRMTLTVGLDDEGRVKTCPPIVRGFVGQPIDNLRRWMGKQPAYIEHEYEL